MNYYSFHIGDYRSATAHLSNEEDLAYRRLLDMYYDTQKPIPVDTQWVSRRLRVGIESVQAVLSDFFELREDGWHNTKADLLLEEYLMQVERNRLNGKKGGRPKNPVGFQSVASGAQPEPSRNPNQEPITNNQDINPPTPLSGVGVPPSPPAGGRGRKAKTDWFVGLPQELDTPEFRAKVLEWVEYRRALKKPVNPASMPAVFRRSMEIGVKAAIDGFETSMANGWQGAFKSKETKINKTAHRDEKRAREYPESIDIPFFNSGA